MGGNSRSIDVLLTHFKGPDPSCEASSRLDSREIAVFCGTQRFITVTNSSPQVCIWNQVGPIHTSKPCFPKRIIILTLEKSYITFEKYALCFDVFYCLFVRLWCE